MPGDRSNQAERRFVAFDLLKMGGHGPFRGQDAPLALEIIITKTSALGKGERHASPHIGQIVDECPPTPSPPAESSANPSAASPHSNPPTSSHAHPAGF